MSKDEFDFYLRFVEAMEEHLGAAPKGETKMAKMIRVDGSICPECAKEQGGVWPDGHVATFSHGTCSVCEQEKTTCAVSDYSWPTYRGEKAPREL